jgi:glycosyltransferase involved in cell wall biosynthesis
MKISILTGTYNRGNLLGNLYRSLIKNSDYGVEIEWLIMDDGSTDNTKEVVREFIEEGKIDIKYNQQENQGKMVAINKLVEQATGELIVDCDSDDYFTDDALKIIKEEFQKTNQEERKEEIYAKCFLKQKENGDIDGTTFNNKITTMFDLYFREGATGEKLLVYYSDIRKQFKHEIENNEKFITEARMYHKIDEKYKIQCINKVLQIGEYKADGYTNNNKKIFLNNPYGYFQYFKEILSKNMKGVIFKKRLYAIKHYILFSVLTNKKIQIKDVKGMLNKILILCLYIPGKIKSNNYKRS